jgi:hypothetical protein
MTELVFEKPDAPLALALGCWLARWQSVRVPGPEPVWGAEI